MESDGSLNETNRSYEDKCHWHAKYMEEKGLQEPNPEQNMATPYKIYYVGVVEERNKRKFTVSNLPQQ